MVWTCMSWALTICNYPRFCSTLLKIYGVVRSISMTFMILLINPISKETKFGSYSWFAEALNSKQITTTKERVWCYYLNIISLKPAWHMSWRIARRLWNHSANTRLEWEIFFVLWFSSSGCAGFHLRSIIQVGIVTFESLATAAGAHPYRMPMCSSCILLVST